MRRLLPLTGIALLAVLGSFGPARAQTHGPNPAYMDTTCAPCKDFFEYANGTWLATTQIPASYSVDGVAREVYDGNQTVILGLLNRLARTADQEKDPDQQKVGWLYRTLMDSTRADREGFAPMRADLDRIAAIRTVADLGREFANESGYTPFAFGAEVDPKESSRNIGQFYQAGLGLPDRDYYFRTDEKSVGLRRNYTDHVARVLGLLGEPTEQARTDAENILKLETALADSSLSANDQRDPDRVYHKLTVRELQALCPSVDWPAFFGAAGVKVLARPTASLDVSMPGFMRQLDVQLRTTPIETWKAYLRFHTVRPYLGWLGQAAFDENFAYVSRLTGQKAPQARWKRASASVDNALGEALGKAYVAVAFPPSSKARMTELVNNLRRSLQQRIETRPWMADATKQQALEKLAATIQKIGYPDHWRDYSALVVDPKLDGMTNLRRALQFEQRRQLAKIGQPVDRMEWQMTPSRVDAYYNPTTNEICFPAGILQPPFFDPQADDAANYGAIGAVIGHELTHGFDDQGRQYDAAGNLRDWWTEKDGKEFDARTRPLIEQYNGYLADDTLHVNGALTLGENLGDLGGLIVAYHAWKLSLQGKPAPASIGGFTPDQRFFLSFAQLWRSMYRPELARLITLTDVHSLPRWRVYGTVSNVPEFARAFGCHAGDPQVLPPGKGTEIW